MKKKLIQKLALLTMLYAVTLATGCSKSSNSGPIIDDTDHITRILYRKSDDQADIYELWSVKNDGTDDHKINLALPGGWQVVDEDMAEVAPDNKTMVVLAYNESLNKYGIYKCNVDGSNVAQVLETPGDTDLGIQDFIGQSSILYWRYPNDAADKELWRANLDGSNNTKVNITLPDGSSFGDEELAKVTSDGKTIIFLTESAANVESIYKCNIDGSNVQLVTKGNNTESLAIQCLANNAIFYRVSDNTTFQDHLLVINLDGSNKTQIIPAIPSGVYLQNEEMAKVSKDGKTLFFSTTTEGPNDTEGTEAIYTAKANGSSAALIKQMPQGTDIAIQSLLEQ